MNWEDEISLKVFEEKLIKSMCDGMGIPAHLMSATHEQEKTAQQNIDAFDRMTANGFKLNLITFQYVK